MKAKRCKLCGGAPKYIYYAIPQPKYVYYAIPQQDYPEGWYESEEGEEPYVLFKRIECQECGATVPHLKMSLDDAVSAWNEQKILIRYGEEKVRDVE